MPARKAVVALVKIHFGGGDGRGLGQVYKRVAEILIKAGYNGRVSLEFDGKEATEIAVPKRIARLREALTR